MGLFDERLHDRESLFRETIALDVDFVPPIIECRESEQQYLASCIKPLFLGRSGRNVVVTGSPGIGKTVAAKHVLHELGQNSEKIVALYVNCWKDNTEYKVALSFCEQLKYPFVANRSSAELYRDIIRMLNKGECVICLDEIDKLENPDLIYRLLEDIYRKCIVIITNDQTWLASLDARIRSRLLAEVLEFRQYNNEEVEKILKRRVEYAFAPSVWDTAALGQIIDKTSEMGDIRGGLYLLKEAGEAAEERAQRKILKGHVATAMKKLDAFTIKKKEQLQPEVNALLSFVRKNIGKTVSELHQQYSKTGSSMSYATFHRKLQELAKGKFITLKIKNKGQQGRMIVVELPSTSLDQFR